MIKLKSRTIVVLMVLASIIVMVLAMSTAFAQTTGAVAGSQSASGAQAGAVGIMINPATPAGGVGTTGFSGSGGASNTSTLSPVGVGVGGSSSASSNASPTIVVGSGNTYEAADLSKRVPGVWSPALTTSNGTCANSFSVGGSTGGLGLSFGKTYVSGPCNARFNANQLSALGQNELAVEVMCGIKGVYEADQRNAAQYGTIPKCVDRNPPEDEVQPVSNVIGPDGKPAVVWFDALEMNEIDELAMMDAEYTQTLVDYMGER